MFVLLVTSAMEFPALNVLMENHGILKKDASALKGLLILDHHANPLLKTDVPMFPTQFGLTTNACADLVSLKLDSNVHAMVLKSEIYAVNALINPIQNILALQNSVNAWMDSLKFEEIVLRIHLLKVMITPLLAMLVHTSTLTKKCVFPALMDA